LWQSVFLLSHDLFSKLILASVVSIHKAQGSEFPVVVMPIVTQHYTMLQRNLLYTAITRARKLCVLAGSAVKQCGTSFHDIGMEAGRKTKMKKRGSPKI
jgi:exodeoxyribonuclease V alpha subunit